MKPKYFRKDNIIKDTDGNVVFIGLYVFNDLQYASNNAAKRKSRKLQAAEGPCLRVIKS